MTIEVPQPSLPQGGAECPPGENLLVASPVGVPTSSLTPGANGPEKPSPAKTTRKRVKTSWSKIKNKRARSKKSPAGSAVVGEEQVEPSQSKDTSRVSGGEEVVVVLGARTNVGGRGSAGGRNGKTTDLKRTPPKARTAPDGSKLSKDEAASRKSLRLKLKNFKPDYKDADPRYFEQLLDIDFDDEGQKIIFMAALDLGYSPGSKPSGKVEKVAGASAVLSHSSTIATGTGPEKSLTGPKRIENGGTDQDCEPIFLKPGKNSDFIDQPSVETPKSSWDTTQLLFPMRHDELDQDTDDDCGWERWVDRLSPVQEPKTEASSQAEIDGFLHKLKSLGTEVKLVRT